MMLFEHISSSSLELRFWLSELVVDGESCKEDGKIGIPEVMLPLDKCLTETDDKLLDSVISGGIELFGNDSSKLFDA